MLDMGKTAITAVVLRVYVCGDVKHVCMWMTVHFLSGLQWQCVDTGRLALLDHLSPMYTVGQFLLPIPLLVYPMCLQFRWQLGRICAWRRNLDTLSISSQLRVWLLSRLQMPWNEHETLYMCPKSWRPTPELCLSTRELMWLHPDHCRFVSWVQSVLCVSGSCYVWSLSIWCH